MHACKNGGECLLKRMSLLATMAVATPVITALLTVVVFLEKDKIKKRSENLEAALKAGNQELVQAVAAATSTLENVAKEVKKVEAAQITVANAVRELQETLKDTVSL